jgi:hypothetical protein
MDETKDKERANKLLKASLANGNDNEYVVENKWPHLDPNWNRDP